jgi:hypothetical protein
VSYAEPHERALGSVSCAFLGNGVLECRGKVRTSVRDVVAFDIGSTSQHGDVVFALGRDRSCASSR